MRWNSTTWWRKIEEEVARQSRRRRRKPAADFELAPFEGPPLVGAEKLPAADLHQRPVRHAAQSLFVGWRTRSEHVLEDGDIDLAAGGARGDVQRRLDAVRAHLRSELLRGVVPGLRGDLRLVVPERRRAQIDCAPGVDSEPEGGVLGRDVSQVGGAPGEKDEPVVRHLGEGGGQLLRAVEDPALGAAPEAGPVAQRRVAERRVEEIVQVVEARRHRGLGALVDEFLEERLLLVRVAELARRVAELRLDDAVELPAQRTDLRGSRASRPDSLRHGRAPLWSGSMPTAHGLRDA